VAKVVSSPADHAMLTLRTATPGFPDSAESGHLAPGVGQSELSAMTHKEITLEFLVPTILAIALGILLAIGAVYVTNHYLGPVDQPEAYHSAAGSQ
jgi:hypothetical protein